LDDDAPERRLDRREALKKAAAIGGALWIVPAVQSVNMTKAWAAVGSDPQLEEFDEETTGTGQGPTGSGGTSGPPWTPEPLNEKRYTVRFDVGPNGATCSQPRRRSCRCLKAETLTGGCSQATASKSGRNGAWVVTVSGQGAQVIEGFAVCGTSAGARCTPGSPVSANTIKFMPPPARGHHAKRAISHIEMTFSVAAARP
jgi:hypothetical protein